MSDIEDIINGLLRLQNIVFGSKPADIWVKEKAIENTGNIAQIVVYEDDKAVNVNLKLDENLNIVKTNEPPKHVLSMHIDTFLDLVSGDMDLKSAYLRGLVTFEGENYHVHAILWGQSFERLRGLIKQYGGGLL